MFFSIQFYLSNKKVSSPALRSRDFIFYHNIMETEKKETKKEKRLALSELSKQANMKTFISPSFNFNSELEKSLTIQYLGNLYFLFDKDHLHYRRESIEINIDVLNKSGTIYKTYVYSSSYSIEEVYELMQKKHKKKKIVIFYKIG